MFLVIGKIKVNYGVVAFWRCGDVKIQPSTMWRLPL